VRVSVPSYGSVDYPVKPFFRLPPNDLWSRGLQETSSQPIGNSCPLDEEAEYPKFYFGIGPERSPFFLTFRNIRPVQFVHKTPLNLKRRIITFSSNMREGGKYDQRRKKLPPEAAGVL
jgi:hypothetical protein